MVFLQPARAVTNVVFDLTQTTHLVATNLNSDTVETVGDRLTSAATNSSPQGRG